MRGGGGTVKGGVLHEVKIISCSKTCYKPNSPKRAVDSRADLLPQEYLNKARAADQNHNQMKLLELGEVRGIVAGNFGEVSEHTHALVAALATYRVRVAGVSRGRKGHMRTEEGERSLAISSLRRRLGVLTVKCQTYSLLGRLEQQRRLKEGGRRRSWRGAGGERRGHTAKHGGRTGLGLASWTS